MQECWINVYYYNGRTWLGSAYSARWRAEILNNNHIAYRIHVKLK